MSNGQFQVKYTIEILKKIIEVDYEHLNFTLVSETYPDLSNYKIRIICNLCSIIYETTINNYKNRTYGCLKCPNGKFYTIETIRNLVEEEYKHFNLTLLSNIYPDPEYENEDYCKFKLQCNECNNIYFTGTAEFKRSKGCPKCIHKKLGKKRSFTLNEVKDIVAQYGFELADENYENSNKPINVKCELGHITQKYLGDLKRNRTIVCSKCVPGKGGNGISEEICRKFFEYLFDKPFVRCRYQ